MQALLTWALSVAFWALVGGSSPSLASTPTNSDNTLGISLLYPKKATLYLGALFPIHTSRRDFSLGVDVCTDLQGGNGIQPVEAMLYTLDQVNRDPDLLPGITLGALVLDSCNAPSLALNQTLGFIKGFLAAQNMYHEPEFTCSDGSAPTFRGGHFDQVVGVIGGQQSSVSVEMASVLRVIETPQISYLSTSASLSNRDRYPFFLRTVPSDTTQVQAILSILRYFKWTHASVVYSIGEYGEGGYRELLHRASDYDVCFTSPAYRLARDDPDDHYQNVVRNLITNDAKVVVVFADSFVALRMMQTVRLSGQHSRFVWLGSDGWSYTTPKEVESVAEGAIAVQPLAQTLPGFDQYFSSLRPENNIRNPWFPEYWQTSFGCSSTDPSCTKLSINSTGNYRQEPWLHFVRDTVYAFAHALHNMWEKHCQGKAGLCEAMAHSGHIHGRDLYQQLLHVTFQDVSNSTFRFQASGSGPARYSILNYQRVDDYTYAWVPVGSYYNTSGEPDLQLNKSKVKYRRQQSFPTSSCGAPCKPSQAKILLQDSCCWRCVDCQPNQYLNQTTQHCINCHVCKRPDPNQGICVDKNEKFIDYRSRWAITSLAFASLGIFSTVLVGIIFWVHLDTPVIKASSRELSYILLGGIFFSFIMTFVIVAPPTFITCGLTRFFLGFSYTLCYAAILTKTNRISRIFNKSPTKSHKARYTSPRSQVVIVTLLVSVEVIINISWLVYYTPSTKHLCDQMSNFRIRICNGLDDYSYIVGLIYPLILVCFCTIYAIKTRKCPGGFNEARYITFTNYTTCLIWLIFVPLYLSTGASDDIRIVSLALSLSLGAFVQLGCLFFPKVYIVLFKPEKNTRDAVMSTKRSSSYNRNSSYRASGLYPPETQAPHSNPPIFFLNAGNNQDIQKVPPPHYQDQSIVGDSHGRVNEVYMSAIQSRANNPSAL